MVEVDGMTKTRALANGIEIKPGKTVELKPGSYRILLLGLKEPFQLGQKVKGWLVFEKAGPVEIVYNVEENPGAAVSGWYFSHPQSQYFVVGRIGKDQVEDYARRKGMSLRDTERWLAPNLGYEPED